MARSLNDSPYLYGIHFSAPAISDITNALPRNAAGFFKRPLDAIRYIVINHTAVRPEIGADRVAQAHIKRWPGIVAQYFITGDGQIQQTNPIDEVVAQNQSWIYNGISIYVAGSFDDAIPGEAQLGALAQLCGWLMATYELPIETINGAKELISTRSPGIQWQTGQNWKGMLLARIAAIQKTSAATPSSTDRAAIQALQAQVTQLTQQITILENEKAALGQQVQTLSAANASLTQQIQTLTGDTTALNQQIQTLASEKASLSQQIQTSTGDKASLGQQIVTLNQTISDLRRQLTESPGGGSAPPVVPVPEIKDVVDQLPKHPINRYATRTLDKITHLTIHHSAAPPNVPIETIARYHVNTNNWPGIGYHFCIEPDGSISQVNRLETISYHAGVVNGYTVGICLEGDFHNGALPTLRQIQSAAHLAAWLSQKLNIPVENVMGHKEFPQNPVECPGDDWNTGQQWKQMLHERVRAVLAGDLAAPAKSIGHYVLFWQRADSWAKEDYAAAVNYVARFRPTHGFSADDARTAEYVTIVGGLTGVSGEIEQKLRNAGCRVERLAGKDFADTQRLLDDLAQRGQRFRTFNV